METFKDKLADLIERKETYYKNKQKLNEHFGEDNLSKIKQKVFEYKFSENSWDGAWFRCINIQTGFIEEYCSIANGETNCEIKEKDLKFLEEEFIKMFK